VLFLGADDVFVYNNIFMGMVSVDPTVRNFNEDNNIFWSFLYDGSYLDTPFGDNSVTVRGGSGFNSGYDTNYFEGSGNFFCWWTFV